MIHINSGPSPIAHPWRPSVQRGIPPGLRSSSIAAALSVEVGYEVLADLGRFPWPAARENAPFRTRLVKNIRQGTGLSDSDRDMESDPETQSERPEVAVTETEWVTFRRSRIHGMGGFARKEIAKGTRVIEYTGERIDKEESVRRCEQNNEFIFTLNETWDLDGNVPENPARLINHSCAPNCDAEVDADRIWVVANRDIRAGEEITFNYGFDLVDYREYPCCCGAPECVGYIVAEEFFEHVRKQEHLSFS